MAPQILTPADFGAFFNALWRDPAKGVADEPFPWQSRLVERVCSAGWPHTLDLPTASGKTAVLDIAVFALAVDATRPVHERRAPRRIVFVVDRRVIVDQAFRRASAICRRLAQADHPVLRVVADNLRMIQADPAAPPLMAAQLRGGMPQESDWARTPTQPLILVSTVDQVGSRLLFRGYGVRKTMRSLHAGLLGEDVLYLLDEVHLSRPFEETLASVKRFAIHNAQPDSGLPHRFELVRMSATPEDSNSEVFSLSDGDRNHPVLAPRIEASKRAWLREVDTRPGEQGRDKIAAACVDAARELFTLANVQVVAVIVNRVDTARRVASLAMTFAEADDFRVVLMTGRMRPLDRDDLLREVEPYVAAGRERGLGGRLLFVSTQAIEAGADFDFDALVTECASLDALKQRFGRLDRFGELKHTRAVIVAGTHELDPDGPPDPVYGKALARTWAWLCERATMDDTGRWFDFGIASLSQAEHDMAPELFSPREHAPLLLPVHVELLAQTAPEPEVCPDVSLFLHGIQRAADVQIVWRGDVRPDWLAKAANDEGNEWLAFFRDLISVAPPSALEAVQVPAAAARSWLSRSAAPTKQRRKMDTPAVSDVEGAIEEAEEAASIAPVLLWQGDDAIVVRDAAAIRPGVTIVVPVTYGGIALGNWDPEAQSPVEDRGDEAQLLHRGRAVIRWEAAAMPWNTTGALPMLNLQELAEYGAQHERSVFNEWAELMLQSSIPAWTRESITALRRGSYRIVRVPLPMESTPSAAAEPATVDAAVRASVAVRRVGSDVVRRLTGHDARIESLLLDAVTEDETGSFVGTAISLSDHLRAVARAAAQYAEAVGLSPQRVNEIELAASLHDVGKADLRFQLMLHGGDRVRAAVATALLAKSPVPMLDRAARARAQRAAGYPDGMRHELASAAMACGSPAIQAAGDPDLVLHLIASHHGRCRPFPPIAFDQSPVDIEFEHDGSTLRCSSAHGLMRLDSGVAERFARLNRRYGWWRLAWLETILRLADHRVSESSPGGLA